MTPVRERWDDTTTRSSGEADAGTVSAKSVEGITQPSCGFAESRKGRRIAHHNSATPRPARVAGAAGRCRAPAAGSDTPPRTPPSRDAAPPLLLHIAYLASGSGVPARVPDRKVETATGARRREPPRSRPSRLHARIRPPAHWVGAGSGTAGIKFNYVIRQRDANVEFVHRHRRRRSAARTPPPVAPPSAMFVGGGAVLDAGLAPSPAPGSAADPTRSLQPGKFPRPLTRKEVSVFLPRRMRTSMQAGSVFHGPSTGAVPQNT